MYKAETFSTYKAGVRYSYMALSPVKTTTKLVQPPMF